MPEEGFAISVFLAALHVPEIVLVVPVHHDPEVVVLPRVGVLAIIVVVDLDCASADLVFFCD
jgi:hypothetical protein